VRESRACLLKGRPRGFTDYPILIVSVAMEFVMASDTFAISQEFRFGFPA